MAATDPDEEISELSSKLASVEAVLDPDAMRAEAESLREQAADPDLWGDQQHAQSVTRRLSCCSRANWPGWRTSGSVSTTPG